jgi:hypothetical protein
MSMDFQVPRNTFIDSVAAGLFFMRLFLAGNYVTIAPASGGCTSAALKCGA